MLRADNIDLNRFDVYAVERVAGLHLADSSAVVGAKRALQYTADNMLNSHANLIPINMTGAADAASALPRSPGLATSTAMGVAAGTVLVVGVVAAAPRVRRWWRDTAALGLAGRGRANPEDVTTPGEEPNDRKEAHTEAEVTQSWRRRSPNVSGHGQTARWQRTPADGGPH